MSRRRTSKILLHNGADRAARAPQEPVTARAAPARRGDAPRLVRVAVPVPVGDAFDYVWTDSGPLPPVGARVRVPFGRREPVGIVVEHPAATSLEESALRPILEVLDSEPVFDAPLFGLLRWAADYYHHPLGEVLSAALPGALRQGQPTDARPPPRFAATATATDREALARRAPRQAQVLELLDSQGPATAVELRARGVTADALRRLEHKGLISRMDAEPAGTSADHATGRGVAECSPARPERGPAPPSHEGQSPRTALAPTLTPAQTSAVTAVLDAGRRFATFLLYGVTGSGKTEVFLTLIGRELDAGRQTLLLVPEISLTPQLVGRLRARFGDELAVFHSALTEAERLAAWRAARAGSARLVVGTRSAVFAPLPNPGLIIVDEEHDPSFKQQQGLRYHARDLAIMRARALGVPVLLASATPSLESFRNAAEGRYGLVQLPERIGAAGKPHVRVIDMNQHAERQGLSTPLLAAIDRHLGRGNQVLLFINRRGFAPVLFCPSCEEAEACARCDARMTIHTRLGVLRCHHCGAERPLRWACPGCGAERIAVGAGTQRVTETLEALYPEHEIARLDRDALTSRHSLTDILDRVERGDTRIIVGTQLLTKGHDFPAVTLVGVLNADQGLFGTDFRAEERLAQTIVQVAGRAGRRDQPGEVVIQTHYPRHPLLERLLDQDYAAFAELALAERRAAGWPPYAHLAVWRAEAAQRPTVFDFLGRVRAAWLAAGLPAGVSVLGPAPAAMERRGGRFRGLLVMQSTNRASLHAAVTTTLAAVRAERAARRVRWSLDIDPVEL